MTHSINKEDSCLMAAGQPGGQKVRLKITGIRSAEGREEQIETDATADYYQTGSCRYIFYMDSGGDGLPVRSRLTIRPGEVEVRKGEGTASSLIFREKEEVESLYHANGCSFPLATRTRQIDLREDEDGMVLRIDYSLLQGGQVISDHKLTAEICYLMQA